MRIGDNNIIDPIEVTNGLRQGCTLAPMLLNLYFSAMVKCLRDQCPQAGITVRFKAGRKLVGDRTKDRLHKVQVTESQFADDTALYANTREVLQLEQVARVCQNWGLTVS